MQSRLEIVQPTDYADSDNDLVTLDRLKSAVGITSDTEDEQLQTLITLESVMIAEQCDRVLRRASGIETFTLRRCESTERGAILALKLFPDVEVESVTVDGVELDESEYEVDAENGHIWRPDAAWSGTVVVTYEGGYSLPDSAPAGLAMACIEAVRERRFAVMRGDTAVRDVAHEGTRVSYFSASLSAASGVFSPTVIDLIKPFKRLHV